MILLRNSLFFDRDNRDSLRQKRADRSEELLENGTTVRLNGPASGNFFGAGFYLGCTGVSTLLLQGEAVLWNEREHFRFGGCLGIGAMSYFSGNYFMFNLMGEAYYLSSGPAAFYFGGGAGMTFLYIDPMVPIPMLRAGLGCELLRNTNFRIDIGPTLDIGFIPGGRVFDSFIPVIGGHIRFLL